jgi:hypothetical protein
VSEVSLNGTDEQGPTRKQRRERAREARRAEEAAQLRAATNRRRLKLGGGALVAILVVAVVALVTLRKEGGPAGEALAKSQLKLAPLASLGALRPSGEAGPMGPEQVPIATAPPAATTATKAGGQPVNGIQCSTGEQVLFHIHAHLTIFVDGAARQVPAGIGIPNAQAEKTPVGEYVGSGNCFYWLHTHAADGIIHTESPVQRVYTLGNFFEIWGQPLSPTQVGPARGTVTALYDSQRYVGDPRNIPLTAHAQIQLEVGRPLVAPQVIEFPAGL